MKILHVNMSLDSVSGGGTVERTVQLVKAFHRFDECQVKVLSTDAGLGSGLRPLPDDQLVLLPCWINRWYFPSFHIQRVFQAVLWADVVHLMNHWSILNAWVYFFAKLLNKPYVVCPAGALEIFGRSPVLKKIYSVFIGKRLIQNADAVIAITEDEEQLFIEYGVPKDRIHLIANGVNANDFECSDPNLFRDEYCLANKPYLLFVGRLNEIKGPDILIRAFASLAHDFSQYHLVLAGPDGGMTPLLEKLIAEHDLDQRVHLVGYIGGAMKSSAYHGADLLVVPSRQEAMSIVALEAGISGTPVVMTDRCGFDSFSDAGAALIVPLDVRLMAEAVSKLLVSKTALALMGKAAELYVRDNFSWHAAVEKYVAVYASIR